MPPLSKSHRNAIHPEIADFVLRIEAEAERATPSHLQSPTEVRAAYLAKKRPLVRTAEGPHTALHIEDRLVRQSTNTLSMRLYRPLTGAPLGVVAYFHGGGFTNGDLDSHDAIACMMATESGCAVASVDYRVMPDHNFPAPFDDAVAALQWLLTWANELGIDRSAVAAAGDSSGANLAMAAALELRETLPLRSLWMAYPIIGADFDTVSYLENAHAPLLTRARCQRILNDYSGGSLHEGNWRVAPLLVEDLSGLPPAIVIAADLDPLRSDAEVLANRLAGTELIRAQRMPHAFLRWIGESQACRRIAKASFLALRQRMDVAGLARD